MKFSELRTGMVVKLVNGTEYYVFTNCGKTVPYTLLITRTGKRLDLDTYSDKDDLEEKVNLYDENANFQAVYYVGIQFPHLPADIRCWDLIWMRNEFLTKDGWTCF